jgi:hypothetical protein
MRLMRRVNFKIGRTNYSADIAVSLLVLNQQNYLVTLLTKTHLRSKYRLQSVVFCGQGKFHGPE